MFDEFSDEELTEEYRKLDAEIKRKSWAKFCQYNVHDTRLVSMLDDKMKLIELVCSIAYMVKCNIKDVASPIKTWDVFIYNYLRERNTVIPPQKGNRAVEFPGAYVKEPVPGMYEWVMSFDFASMYPHIIMEWNLSPETYVHGHQLPINADMMVNPSESTIQLLHTAKEEGYAVAANGTVYRKDVRGFLGEMMETLYANRSKVKKQMLKLEQTYQDTHDESLTSKIAALDNAQMAIKILLNSAYGAVSSPYFRYFNVNIAEAITQCGVLSIKHMEQHINKYMQGVLGDEKDRIITCDTDAFYITMKDLLVKVYGDAEGNIKIGNDKIVDFLDRVGEGKIQKQIDQSINYVADLCNAYAVKMSMKREVIANKGIYTTKKRYALSVYNSEGVSYNPPKIKIKGLDLIKSSTPKKIRGKLKEALNVIFEKDEAEVRQFTQNYYKEFCKMPVEDIAFPRSVNDLTKYLTPSGSYGKGSPIHVRGSILYNIHTKPLKKYDSIRDGDKIKFVYLKMPNIIKEDVISFPSNESLPTELNLQKYVDYDLQWEKSFISPLKGLTDAIGWKLEEAASLEDFFG
jgi:DNA polymerase elongation subunit (family B)